MQCPYCKHPDTQVIDSRASEDGNAIRRRRRCPSCLGRFTTYEKVALSMPLVVKRDGHTRVPYSHEKLLKSMELALRKRPVTAAAIEAAVDRIEQKIRFGEKEIESQRIGELVLGELEILDKVAYMRFASVYFNYSQPDDFVAALEKLGFAVSKKS